MTTLVIGGGTFSDVTPHLSLCTRAFGTTAKQIDTVLKGLAIHSHLVLTKMANSESDLISNKDVQDYITSALRNPELKAVVFNTAMCDFRGEIENFSPDIRLTSNDWYQMSLYPDTVKVLASIKKERPDVFLVGFKTTAHKSQLEQIQAAKTQILNCGCDLVLANDIKTRANILIDKVSAVSGPRQDLLNEIGVEIKKTCYLSKPLRRIPWPDSSE